jgi:hypothetical protein
LKLATGKRPGARVEFKVTASGRGTRHSPHISSPTVLIRGTPIQPLAAFGLAGAYAWNISHHDFLMPPHRRFTIDGQ